MYHEAVCRSEHVRFLSLVSELSGIFFFFQSVVYLLLLEDFCDAKVNTVFPDDEPTDCDTQMNVIKQ